jgi:CelD/BcsL family acetyltransferase involved in cellulose biosynthesis
VTVTDYAASLPITRSRTDEDAGAAATRTSIAEVAVFRDPREVEAAWAELEARAPSSLYQTRAFLKPWMETLGAMRGIAPMFILGRDALGQPAVLLCLGIERHGPFRIGTFLGGKESNFNLGLCRPDVRLGAADLGGLLRAAATSMGAAGPHCFLLLNQPETWEGVGNPLAALPHQASPSFAYTTPLEPNGEKFVASKQSKDTRKKLRKKEARLAELGAVVALTNDTPDTARAIVGAFLRQKIARSEAQAYDADFATSAMQSFLEKLATPQGSDAPALEFHALTCGEKIVATYAGGTHRNHFSCLVNSFDADAEIAKSSPGDLLLMRLIANQCDKGRAGFDLGIGEARYKASYCDVTLPLFDTVFPIGIVGRIYGASIAARLRLKRTIKQNPQLFARLKRLRQTFSRSARH